MNVLNLIRFVSLPLDKALTIIIKIFLGLALCMTGVMTAVILLQVVCRYFFGNALAWPEELARFMMVWMTFLVAPYAYRNKLNVGVEIFTDRIDGFSKRLLTIFTHLLIGFLSFHLMLLSVDMTLRGAEIRASSINLSLNYVYCILPASFILLSLISVEKVMSYCLNDKPVKETVKKVG